MKSGDEMILEIYRKAGLQDPVILHASDPVQALQWWGVLSTVTGPRSATSVLSRANLGNYWKPWTPAMRTSVVLRAADEARITMTPERAIERCAELKSLIPPEMVNISAISCSGIGSRVRRAMFPELKDSDAFGCIAGKQVVISTPHPQVFRTENLGRDKVLHCDKGPAVSWGSFSLWYIHGVELTRQQYDGDLTFDDFLRISNSEVRRVLVDRKGWDWLASHLKEVDRAPDPGNPGQFITLYALPARLQNQWDRRKLVIMVNASPSRSGAKMMYGEFVPIAVTSALGAQAWAWDVPVKTYRAIGRAT